MSSWEISVNEEAQILSSNDWIYNEKKGNPRESFLSVACTAGCLIVAAESAKLGN